MKKKAKWALRPPARRLISSSRAAGISVLMAASLNPAFADPGKAVVNIPPQELSSALKVLAGQTDSQLLFATDALQGARTEGVSGSYTPEEALKRLLKGTRFTYRTTDANSFTVQREGEKKPETVAAARHSELLPEVVVTATRTERLITEVPASVSVITAEDIKSQQVVKLEDLLRNVEGVDVKSEAGGGAGMVMLRGMGGSYAGQTTQLLVDGMPVEPMVLAPKGAGLDFAGSGEIDRIEVVRGPASSLYGPNAAGGVINVLTKRWTGEPGGEAEAGLGSHNARSARAVVGGSSEKIDFRLSASDFQTDGFIAEPKPYFWGQQDLAGRDWRDRKFGAQLGIYPSDNQAITFGVRHYDIDSAFVGGRPNYRFGREGALYDLGYKLELGALGDLKFRYLSATIKENLKWDGLMLGDGTDFTRYITGQRDEFADTLEAQANLRLTQGNLLTLGLSHTTGKQKETEDTAVPLTSQQGWDYYARSEISTKTRIVGLYVQDEIRVSENALLNIGGRYDRYRLYDNTSYSWDNYGTDTTRRDPDSTDSVFNPRFGLRYKLAERTSLYASYGTAYLPALNGLRYRSNATCNSPNLNAEHSASTEIGLNQEWAGLSARAALFHTDYQDKIEALQRVGCTQYVNVSAVKVNGFEIALEGKTASAWRPYFNYTYSDSRIDGNPSQPASEGKRLNLVAKHKLSLGVIYAPSAGWTARLSGRYVGDRYFDGTMENKPDALAPGYFVADLKVGKRMPLGALARDAELSLAVNNLFDKEYVEQKWLVPVGAGKEAYRAFGDGRNWWLGLNVRF
ncbi:MAG: TonB-dependent receptor [Sulfuricella sp.]|nr:TonB-dependent receptor [Sulfuricella sp.]